MTPVLSSAEAAEHRTFMALMWAISHPGKVQTLEGIHGLESVGKALLDLETRFYTSDPGLHQLFARLGAQAQTPQKAAYQFYPQLDSLEELAQAPIGSLPYPETGATLVLSCGFGGGLNLKLSGPGIQGVREIQIAGLPPGFWSLRNERVSFPLGWDLFLVSQGELISIPRSTKVEVV